MSRPAAPPALGLLTSPAFLAALGLLVLNDRYLKAHHSGWITGKLSDVAGLFAFALFWTALLPRGRRAVHVAVGVGFALWKTPAAAPAIAAWNAVMPFAVGRVVDYSDWLALLVLPLSAWYARRHSERPAELPRPARLRLRDAVVIVAALAAFVATSEPYDDFRDGARYVVALPREEVREHLAAELGATTTTPAPKFCPPDVRHSAAADTIRARLTSGPCVTLEVSPTATGETLVTVVLIHAQRSDVEDARLRLAEGIIAPLRARSAGSARP
ncbi:MAG TPA: hypothetical protein VNA89_04770 [Gemmatimonadaceae bacterium]|nr:hypothetical protein [Gemmatimonadaceae bacterium]